MIPFSAIGIDVGGTKIAGGVVTFPEGKVHARETVPTPTDSGPILNTIERLARSLQGSAQSQDVTLCGVGLALCEIVSAQETIASQCLTKWPEDRIREKLSRIAPVRIEADVRAAARAEALLGAGQNLRNFVYVSIGTGISSCLVIDGEPFLGAHGATGTFASGPLPFFSEGHQNSPAHSLEQIGSGPALVSRFNTAGGTALKAQDVLAAASSGDVNAIRIIESGAAALGGAIGWLVNLLDPERVILGGGLGLSEGLFRETLLRSARTHIWWPNHRAVPIVSAQTGTDAGWIGGAAAVWKEKGAAH